MLLLRQLRQFVFFSRERPRNEESFKNGGRIQREEQENKDAQRNENVGYVKPDNVYFNTVGGITAVLRPKDYLKVQEWTDIARRDGFWQHEHMLMPSPNTVVFVTKQGSDLIMKWCVILNIHMERKIAGWASELDVIVEQWKVKLIHDPQIFVPWLDNYTVSLQEQAMPLLSCKDRGNVHFLLESQVPKDLQPIGDPTSNIKGVIQPVSKNESE